MEINISTINTFITIVIDPKLIIAFFVIALAVHTSYTAWTAVHRSIHSYQPHMHVLHGEYIMDTDNDCPYLHILLCYVMVCVHGPDK